MDFIDKNLEIVPQSIKLLIQKTFAVLDESVVVGINGKSVSLIMRQEINALILKLKNTVMYY